MVFKTDCSTWILKMFLLRSIFELLTTTFWVVRTLKWHSIPWVMHVVYEWLTARRRSVGFGSSLAVNWAKSRDEDRKENIGYRCLSLAKTRTPFKRLPQQTKMVCQNHPPWVVDGNSAQRFHGEICRGGECFCSLALPQFYPFLFTWAICFSARYVLTYEVGMSRYDIEVWMSYPIWYRKSRYDKTYYEDEYLS